jgi:hypothetical protein
MPEQPKRRPLLGKKLLVVAGMSAISQLDCVSSATANLVAPPIDAQVERDARDDAPTASDAQTPRDDGTTIRDVPVANLIPPPDVVQPPTDDGTTMRDVPVANLLPPPDVAQPTPDVVTPVDNGVMIRDVPVANLIPPPLDAGR